MYCNQYFFGVKHYLIKIHAKKIIHQNDGISMRNSLKSSPSISIFHLKFKENNVNDMVAHGICFDFYYRLKPSQIGENGSAAAADAPLAE